MLTKFHSVDYRMDALRKKAFHGQMHLGDTIYYIICANSEYQVTYNSKGSEKSSSRNIPHEICNNTFPKFT